VGNISRTNTEFEHKLRVENENGIKLGIFSEVRKRLCIALSTNQK